MSLIFKTWCISVLFSFFVVSYYLETVTFLNFGYIKKTFNLCTCSYRAKSIVIIPPNHCDIIPLPINLEATIRYSEVNLSFTLLPT